MVLRHHGYRSDFELSIAVALNRKNVKFKYESEKIDYVRHSTYNPDFTIDGKDFYIEAKGLFTTADRGTVTRMSARRVSWTGRWTVKGYMSQPVLAM